MAVRWRDIDRRMRSEGCPVPYMRMPARLPPLCGKSGWVSDTIWNIVTNWDSGTWSHHKSYSSDFEWTAIASDSMATAPPLLEI